MRRARISFFVLLLSLTIGRLDDAAANALPELPPSAYDLMYGKTPDRNAENWIRIIALIPRSRPLPITFVSPTKFAVREPQELILLSRPQYRSFSRISLENRCIFSPHYKPSQVLEVTQYSTGRTRVLCRMPLEGACRYLNEIRAIQSIDWNRPEGETLRNLRSIFRCR
jgi:hypothetical protein